MLRIFSLTAQPVTDKNKIMDYLQNQQFEEAISYLSPALASDSDNSTLLGYIGYVYYMNDKEEDAARIYQHLLRLDSSNTTALHYLVLLTNADDPDQAIQYTARLLSLQPSKAAWWRTMGDLLRRKEQPDSALFYLEQAYLLAPADNKTISSLTDLLIQKKAYPRADSILDIALAKDSLNPNFLKLRVRSAYLAGDFPGVLAPGERTLLLEEPILQSQTWLALSYYNLQKYSDCIRVCEYMLGKGLDVEAIYYYEARAQAKLKQYTLSDSLLNICLSKAISHTAEWYYYDLGGNYEALKDFKKAIASYDTAFYLFKDPTMLYNCGRICESNLHNTNLARQYYRRYLALAHPQSPDEKKAYAYVRSRWGIHPPSKKPGAK